MGLFSRKPSDEEMNRRRVMRGYQPVRKPPPKPPVKHRLKQHAAKIGTGFVLGFVVGSLSVGMHGLMTAKTLAGYGKPAMLTGSVLGVCFAVGQYVRGH